jgi:hypothetical protein
LLALVVLLFFLLQRFQNQDWNQHEIGVKNPLFFILGFLLMPLNWWTEWRKWTLSLECAEVKPEKSTSFHSFLAGMITGMLTPNMLGNFIGRILYFERKYRIQLTLLTFIGSMSQFVITMLIGALGIVLLQKMPFTNDLGALSYIIISMTSLAFLFFYFRLEWLLKFMRKRNFAERMITILSKNRDIRLRMLILALIRHVVFTLQFACVLYAFGIAINAKSILWIWQFYFWITLAPSLFLGKLGVRESVAVWVFAAAGMAEISVVLSAFSIWVMNLFVPTVLSLVFLKRAKQ